MHSLYAFEEDFVEDGTRAVCMCGWKSEPQTDLNKAMENLKAKKAYEAHEKEANDPSKPCPYCGEDDRNYCGCDGVTS